MTAPYKLRFRPRRPSGDVGRWYLEIIDPPPGAKGLLPCVDPITKLPLYTGRSDREKVAAWAKQTVAPALGPILAAKVETADQWMDRFVLSRTGKITTVHRDHGQWLKWISPVAVVGGSFGAKSITKINADDVEAVRDHLNAQIDAWEAAGKTRGVGLAYHTAANIWSILTCAMKHARTRRGTKALRVTDSGSPCDDVRPPKRGDAKRRHWLRSAWINAALASPDNDTPIKEAVAIGVGLHLRPGELHELRVRDLDLGAGEVSITRSYDEDEAKVTEPKTDEGVRTVTIPDWLMPLLVRIARDRGANDHVAPWVAATPEGARARLFRDFLRAGGEVPAELYVDTPTHEQIDFRSIRDTGITLRFLAGERAEVVQREAGHEHIATTLGYAKAVSNRGNRYGSPALTLPAELAGNDLGELSGNKNEKARSYAGLSVARACDFRIQARENTGIQPCWIPLSIPI
ncbi:MAG: hypothetical protein KF795_00540 [Labilithrix sp.]|nr:hypothetical protein [Labilithrix sp.]